MAPLLALVDFAAIANPDDEDAQCAVLNIGNDAIVADSIFPEISQLGTFQGLANSAWVIELSDSLEQKFQNALRGLAVKLSKLFFC